MTAALLVVLSFLGCDEPRRPFVPTSQYVERDVAGWTVRVNRRLIDGDRVELGTRALGLLETKLDEVAKAIPQAAVARLREVPIWLGVDDGHAPCAEYHPSRDWLVQNGYNPDKARCVEIGNAANFVGWIDDQPAMVLHELAHAYHDRVLGFEDPVIAAAYERAKASGKYDRVRHVRGNEERAYALVDAHEFFAELSEAYFGRNDFEPFDRSALKAFDPESSAIVERAWGVRLRK